MSAGEPVPDAAQLFAALSGPFEPKLALAARPSAEGSDNLAMSATRLAELCDVSLAGAGGRWLMRTSVRHALFKRLGPEQLAAAAAEQRANGPDPETADLLAVLLDQPPLSQAELEHLIKTSQDSAELERVIVALDRAGDLAPAHGQLQAARAALAELHRAAKRQRVAERGFFGREPESAVIADWLSHSVEAAPVRCLLVTGGPGMGKSALLAESVRRYHDLRKPLVLRLDFDRAGLDVQDQLGLTMEATRQLAEQMGDAGPGLLNARLHAGRVSEPSAKLQFSLRQRLPEPLASQLGAAVSAAQRPVLVVLDTLEVLRGRGETHPESLFRWLDELVARGVKPMHVLAAGRGEALDALSPRVQWLELPGLEDPAAELLLAKLEAPRALWPELLQLAQGNPLKLRLGAEIAKASGAEKLLKRKDRSELSAAFLYRFLLSRIEDPELRRLAHPGLIVRRINADLVREVLAPRLGLPAMSPQRAESLLQQLASHHWLVEPDPGAPGFLQHRSDMRGLLLPLLYRSAKARAASIDAAAIAWFAKIPQAWAQLEAVYHQLQLTRTGQPPPSVSAQIAAQFDTPMLDELPAAAADLVRAMRGERTSQLRGAPSSAHRSVDDASVAREILSLVQRQDWIEGGDLVRRVAGTGGLDVRGPAADAIRTFFWRSGQWAQARRWLVERDRFDNADDDLGQLPEPLALARLEMRAEFDPDTLRRRWPVWSVHLKKLERVAVSSSDNVARHGALALLLAGAPEPFRFPRSGTREADVAAAAHELWAGERGAEAHLAVELARQRLGRVTAQGSAADETAAGRLLATLTPYAAVANTLSLVEGHAALREVAQRTAEVLAQGGGLLGRPPLSAGAAASDPVGCLADFGAFAEWAGASAFLSRDADLTLIARAAERWRRTMAGDWSVGRRRQAWMSLPALDQTLLGRVHGLAKAPDPAGLAHEQLRLWAEALGVDALLPLLRRRLRCLQAEAIRQAAEKAAETAAEKLVQGSEPEVVTRCLLARGAPAAFAPALAVLIVHRQL